MLLDVSAKQIVTFNYSSCLCDPWKYPASRIRNKLFCLSVTNTQIFCAVDRSYLLVTASYDFSAVTFYRKNALTVIFHNFTQCSLFLHISLCFITRSLLISGRIKLDWTADFWFVYNLKVVPAPISTTCGIWIHRRHIPIVWRHNRWITGLCIW